MPLKLPLYFALAYIFCFPAAVLAEPFSAYDEGSERVVIYTEPCKFKDVVANLPRHATWTEKGKVFEGCAGADKGLGVVLFYFPGDKSVAGRPIGAFQPLTGV